jgi:hypothetical protein
LKFKADGENVDKAFIQVIDLLNGREKVEYYHSNPEIGATLACYAGGSDFVFASVDDDNHLFILRTGPQ